MSIKRVSLKNPHRPTFLFSALLLSLSTYLFAANNPLPPEGEPLPTKREQGHNLGCPNNDAILIEDIPMAITQACAKSLNYQVLENTSGKFNVIKFPGEFNEKVICGRKGRKAYKTCIRNKMNQCVEMSNMQERRVPHNYCKTGSD